VKFALVTGGTSGIGLAIARRLICEGYFVLINHRPSGDPDGIPKISQADIAPRWAVCSADLSDMSGVAQLAEQVELLTDSLDVVVLNAGATEREEFGSVSVESWSRVLSTNLSVPFFLIQRLHRLIPDGGRILFTGSSMGIYPHSVSLAYGVSKAAVHFLARSLPKVLEGRAITVNAIAPGFVETPWQVEKTGAMRERISEKIALHRFGRPEEVADLAWHIIQNEYVNGAVIQIDGGYSYR